MPADHAPPDPPPASGAAADRAGGPCPLSPAAARALAEAAARRAERDANSRDRPKELQGRDGLDPTRYGDWEVNGLISDF